MIGSWLVFTGGHDHVKGEGHKFHAPNTTSHLRNHNHDHHKWEHPMQLLQNMSSSKKVNSCCTCMEPQGAVNIHKLKRCFCDFYDQFSISSLSVRRLLTRMWAFVGSMLEVLTPLTNSTVVLEMSLHKFATSCKLLTGNTEFWS